MASIPTAQPGGGGLGILWRRRLLLATGGYEGGFPIRRNLDPRDSIPLRLGRTNAPPYFSFPNPNWASHELYSAKMRYFTKRHNNSQNPASRNKKCCHISSGYGQLPIKPAQIAFDAKGLLL
jgi:hypothetical protein